MLKHSGGLHLQHWCGASPKFRPRQQLRKSAQRNDGNASGSHHARKSRELCVINDYERNILDRFWQVRGVFDARQRADLIACVTSGSEGISSSAVDLSNDTLPGVGAASRLNEPAGVAEVRWASQQILQLDRLLGNREDIDVVSMIARQPQ